jgi:hypothetical protein
LQNFLGSDSKLWQVAQSREAIYLLTHAVVLEELRFVSI